MHELSVEYEQTAAMLRQRISELEGARRETRDEQRRLQLERRLRPLRSMYRDTRAVARYLNGYYQKHTLRQAINSRDPWGNWRRNGKNADGIV